MVDEIDRTEDQTRLESGGENPPQTEEIETGEKISELERLVFQKDEEMTEIETRFNELEQIVTGKDDEIIALKRTVEETEEKLASVNNSLTEAVSSYKKVVIQSNPEIVEELIAGETIESINESLDNAKNLVSKVRQGLETEISLAKVPAGAPERTVPDLSALSPREKIQYAIGQTR